MSTLPVDPRDLEFARLHRHLLLSSEGRFNLIRVLGRGGLGSVYLARDEVTRDLVAAKFPTDPDSFERFERAECVAVKTLSRYRGMPKYVADGVGLRPPYLIMNYVKGKTLREILHEKGPLPLATTIEVARNMLQPLAYAHAEGIAHRDVKPSNLIITDEGRVALLDFGTAAVNGLQLTAINGIVGTTAYLAPSRIIGETDQASVFNSDLYSVGVVLFERINGRLPDGHSLPSKYAVARMVHQLDNGIHTQIDSLETPFEREFIGRLVDADNPMHVLDALRSLDKMANSLGIPTPEYSPYRAHHRKNDILAALATDGELDPGASARRIRKGIELAVSGPSGRTAETEVVMAGPATGTTLILDDIGNAETQELGLL